MLPCCLSAHSYFHFMWNSSCVMQLHPVCCKVSLYHPSPNFFFIFALAAQIQLNTFLLYIQHALAQGRSPKLGSESAEAWFIQFSNLWNPKLTLFKQSYVSLDSNNFILDCASEQNEMLRSKKLEESSYCVSRSSVLVGKTDDWVIMPEL